MNDNVAICGVSNGDEGKGAITHRLSPNFDFVVRTSGGGNCGHTVYADGKKLVFHQVPSIDFRSPNTKGYLGSGMVINLDALLDELTILERDYPGASKRIVVDRDAFLVAPRHIEADASNVERWGSTNKGIGPAYVEKMNRQGCKVGSEVAFITRTTEELQKLGVQFKYLLELYDEFAKSKVLFEGAQGILLDLNFGTYPYVSCGDATVGSVYSSGFGFIAPSTVYGVSKAYCTKVGNGPFPTEYIGEEATRLREKGKEWGATTGRPRKVGALDLPAIRYATKRGGLTHLILTKLDVLNGDETVKVCHKYDSEPVSGESFFYPKPEYMTVQGWKNARDKEQIKPFVSFVEEATRLPVSYVSCGVNEDDMFRWR